MSDISEEEKKKKTGDDTTPVVKKTQDEVKASFLNGDYTDINDQNAIARLNAIDEEISGIDAANYGNEDIVTAATGKKYNKLIDIHSLYERIKHNSTYWDSGRQMYTGKGQKLAQAITLLDDAQNRGFRFIPQDDGTYEIVQDGKTVDASESGFRGLSSNAGPLLDMFTKKHNTQKGISKAMSLAIQNNVFEEDPEYTKAKKALDSNTFAKKERNKLLLNKQDILNMALNSYTPSDDDPPPIPPDPNKGIIDGLNLKQKEQDDQITVLQETIKDLQKDKITTDNPDADKTKNEAKSVIDILGGAEFDLEWKDALPLLSAGLSIASARSHAKNKDKKLTLGLLAGSAFTDIMSYAIDDDVHGKELTYNLYGTLVTFAYSTVAPKKANKESLRGLVQRVTGTAKGRARFKKLAAFAAKLLLNQWTHVTPMVGGMVYKIYEDIKAGKKVNGNEIMAVLAVIAKAALSRSGVKPPKDGKINTSAKGAFGVIPGATGKVTSDPPVVPLAPTTIAGPYVQPILKRGGKIQLQKFLNGGKLVPKGQSSTEVNLKKKYIPSESTPTVGPNFEDYFDNLGLQYKNTPAYLDSLKFPTSTLSGISDKLTTHQNKILGEIPQVMSNVANMEKSQAAPDEFGAIGATPPLFMQKMPASIKQYNSVPLNLRSKPYSGYEINPKVLNAPLKLGLTFKKAGLTLNEPAATVDKALGDKIEVSNGAVFTKVLKQDPSNPNADPVVMYINSKDGTAYTQKQFDDYIATAGEVTDDVKNTTVKRDYTNSPLGPQGPLGLLSWGDTTDLALAINNYRQGTVEIPFTTPIAPARTPKWMPRALGPVWGEKQKTYNDIENMSRTIIQGSDAIANILASISGANEKSKHLQTANAGYESAAREARALNDAAEQRTYTSYYEDRKNQIDYENKISEKTDKINYQNEVTRRAARTELLENISIAARQISANMQTKDQAVKDAVIAQNNRKVNTAQNELNNLIALGKDKRSEKDEARITELRDEITRLINASDAIKEAQYLAGAGTWGNIFRKRTYNLKDRDSNASKGYETKKFG